MGINFQDEIFTLMVLSSYDILVLLQHHIDDKKSYMSYDEKGSYLIGKNNKLSECKCNKVELQHILDHSTHLV
jgi:hypothetical protein